MQYAVYYQQNHRGTVGKLFSSREEAMGFIRSLEDQSIYVKVEHDFHGLVGFYVFSNMAAAREYVSLEREAFDGSVNIHVYDPVVVMR